MSTSLKILALILAVGLLPNCERSLEISPGRQSAIIRDFECTTLGDYPAALRVVGQRHGMRWREQGTGIYMAAGVLGTSEFLVQYVEPNAKVSLYVQHGTRATAAERAMLDELAAVFSSCREQPQIGGRS